MDKSSDAADALQRAWGKPEICPKLNRQAEKKVKQTGASSHKHKNRKLRPWKHWLAQTARIKYSLPPSDPEESSFHLQNLFTISSDGLHPIAGGSRSQQSIKLNIFNMPPAQKAKIEEKLKTEISSTIKVEILNLADKQQIEMRDAIQPQEAKCFITPQAEIIDISDEEGDKVDSDADKEFEQKSSTSLLHNNKVKSSIGAGKQNTKIEMLDMPPLQKAKTEEYVKSQPISSAKAEVINPTTKASSVVEDLSKDLKPELAENSTSCEMTSVCSSHQNIMLKIYNPPKVENTNETSLSGQGSSVIQLEIINVPLAAAVREEESKLANKLQIQIPNRSDARVTNFYKGSDTNLGKRVPTPAKEQLTLCTLKSQQASQTVHSSKPKTTSTLSQIPSATSKSSSKASFPTLRMRQMELHRLRVQVEHKRLELLNLKLAREWQEMERLKVTLDKNSKSKYFDGITLDDVVDI